MAESVETAIYRLRVEGEEQIKRVTQSIHGMDTAQEDATASNRRLTQQIQRGLAAYDPVLKAQQQYNRQLELNARARESGAASLGELAAHQELITQNYQRQVQAVNQLGSATKGARFEMINLGRQAQDVVVSLAGGQNILMVGLQQGSQILDVFASSQRSAGEVFKQMGTAIMSFVTNPLTLALGTTTALGVATLAVANAWDKVTVSSARAISGAGARTGTTVEDLNRFVSQNARVSGSGLSDKEVRQLGEAFTATGDIVISKLGGMSDAVVGFANQSGKSIDDAIKDFVRFGRDPVKAMDELAKVFGPVDQETRKLVERFSAAGDKTSALVALVRGLSDDSKKAAENMGFLEKVWRQITTLAGKETAKPSGLGEQLTAAQGRLGGLMAAPQGGGYGQVGPRAADIREAADEVARLNAEMEKRSAETFAAQMADVADKARGVTEAVIPEIAQLRSLEEQLNKLKAAQAAGVGGPDTSAAIQSLEIQVQKTNELKEGNVRVNAELAKMAEHYKGISLETVPLLAAMDDELAVLKAHGETAKKNAQYAKDYNDAIRAGKSETDATAIASKNAALNTERARNAAREATSATREWSQAMVRVANAADDAQDAINQAAEAASRASAIGSFAERKGSFGNFDVPGSSTGGTGGPAVWLNTGEPVPEGPISLKTGQSMAWEDAWQERLNQTIAEAEVEETRLFDELRALRNATEDNTDVTRSNTEALSPYYSQDPRSSHIGFRSQGMADGGYVTVPGGVSSNDNMIATVPVASGERIYVEPMSGARGRGGGGTSISISMPITIQGGANRDDVGRTLYQAGQSMARQLRAAAQ